MRRYIIIVVLAVGLLSVAYAHKTWPWLFGRVEPSPTVTKVLFDGDKVLDSKLGITRVRVYEITKLSTGPGDMDDFWRNRIEVDTSGQRDMLTWDGFAGDRVDFRDLDKDGVSEILVYLTDYQVRVASFQKGRLIFRGEHDELDSLTSPEPTDLNSDGIAEFTFVVAFPGEGSAEGIQVPMPHFANWKHDTGFEDVTPRFHEYLKKVLLPQRRAQLLAEGDTKRLALFDQGLTSYRGLSTASTEKSLGK